MDSGEADLLRKVARCDLILRRMEAVGHVGTTAYEATHHTGAAALERLYRWRRIRLVRPDDLPDSDSVRRGLRNSDPLI
jgi:hypothetical protein